MMKPKIKIPDAVVEAYKKKKLVLFVGAGLSAMCGLPTWKQLMLQFIKECENHSCDGKQLRWLKAWHGKREYARVAERCYQILPTDSFIGVLTKACKKKSNPGGLHKVITSLELPCLITTNYDQILERSYAQFKRTTVSVFTHLPAQISVANDEDGFYIFKIHGDIDRPETLIVTQSHYDGIMKNNKSLELYLNAILFNHKLLFVGYSISDPDINYFLDFLKTKLGAYARSHFAIADGLGAKKKEDLRSRFNIITLPVKRNMIEKFFKQLAKS
ncbi:MAG: SIR2 family protein [Candidatus Zixiibacteriota bacterium]